MKNNVSQLKTVLEESKSVQRDIDVDGRVNIKVPKLLRRWKKSKNLLN